MLDIDELDINPFFKALQTKFLWLYERAQAECYTICLPHSKCLHGIVISQKFVDMHILKPSKFFKDQYSTLHSDKQIVLLDDSDEYISTHEGFTTKARIRIISEELCYNKDYRPYKMLIIEEPLDQTVATKGDQRDVNIARESAVKLTKQECLEFLKSYPEFAQQLSVLEEQIVKFNRSYILLKDYLSDASDRLKGISSSVSEECVKCIKAKDKEVAVHQFRAVSASVEIYLIASVWDKLYSVICTKFEREDANLLSKCQSLQGLTAEYLNVPKQFACPVPSAILEMSKMDSLKTAIEKLFCLKMTMGKITEEITFNIQKSLLPGDHLQDMPCLTSDDLIPILVTVLVQAKCAHVLSDIYCMENFCWEAATHDKETLSYHLVTFTAAVQYLITNNFDVIDLISNSVKNDLSIRDRVKQFAGKQDMEKQDREKQNKKLYDSSQVQSLPTDQHLPTLCTGQNPSRQRTSPRSCIDKKLEGNITKLMEENKQDLKATQKNKPTDEGIFSVFGGHRLFISPLSESTKPSQSNNRSRDMGDFLSSLMDDPLTIGKQS